MTAAMIKVNISAAGNETRIPSSPKHCHTQGKGDFVPLLTIAKIANISNQSSKNKEKSAVFLLNRALYFSADSVFQFFSAVIGTTNTPSSRR